MTLLLTEIRDLAYRFVPGAAADERLYGYGARSWWPAHEIGHFLVATHAECRQYMFGLDDYTRESYTDESPKFHYVISKEIAAISISQRMLRRSGHVALADEEIQYTDTGALECSFECWCKRAVITLLRANKIVRLPTTFRGMETLLVRKAHDAGTTYYSSRRAAEGLAPSRRAAEGLAPSRRAAEGLRQ